MSDVVLRELADGALHVEFAEAAESDANAMAVAIAQRLGASKPRGLLDAIPGARTLLVLFDSACLGAGALRQEILNAQLQAAVHGSRVVRLPVLYGGAAGPDLEEIASRANLRAEEFVSLHSAADYRVAFIGFAPGFPYLIGLPERLRARRLPSPRPRVAAGSVGIGDTYTGIYPQDTPGGWRLIGLCPTPLFDPRASPPAFLQPGDRVEFYRIEERQYSELKAQSIHPPPAPPATPVFRVASGGLCTSVQGGPRFGWGSSGVPPGGAMDLPALRRANRLLENALDEPGLEMTLLGPRLEALRNVRICLAGAEAQAAVDGRTLGLETVCDVSAGQQLQIGAIRSGARTYLCVAGGLEEPEFGAPFRRLARGDMIGQRSAENTLREASTRAALRRREDENSAGAKPDLLKLRVVLGPQEHLFSSRSQEKFLSQKYRVTAQSDRRGIRLEGDPIDLLGPSDIPPEGTAPGAVQVPGNGLPIILGPDRPVTGGYAKIATVIGADLAVVAQARPGDIVHFQAVTIEDAMIAARNGDRMTK